jgi:hypothetical protein
VLLDVGSSNISTVNESQKKGPLALFYVFIGRGREIRTPDILLPKQARYQTALYPDKLAIIRVLFECVNREMEKKLNLCSLMKNKGLSHVGWGGG